MKHELIGKKVEIKYHNKTFRGEVVDETKNTICLKSKNQKKKCSKMQHRFCLMAKKLMVILSKKDHKTESNHVKNGKYQNTRKNLQRNCCE